MISARTRPALELTSGVNRRAVIMLEGKLRIGSTKFQRPETRCAKAAA